MHPQRSCLKWSTPNFAQPQLLNSGRGKQESVYGNSCTPFYTPPLKDVSLAQSCLYLARSWPCNSSCFTKPAASLGMRPITSIPKPSRLSTTFVVLTCIDCRPPMFFFSLEDKGPCVQFGVPCIAEARLSWTLACSPATLCMAQVR